MTEGIDQETYKRLASERITNTSIGLFDQLTIISQRAINGQLAHMWRKPDSPLRKIDIRPYGDEAPDYFFDANLSAPTVNLSLGPNKQTVVFCLNVKVGLGPVTEEIGPSRLALRVNMAFDQLAKSDVPQNIKDALINVDDYTADLIPKVNGIDKNESDFTISKDAEKWFYPLLEYYLATLREKGPDGKPAEHNIINYTATAKNPKVFTAAPTCAPTNLNFQNLPFVLKESDKLSPDAVLGGKNSMLVYLQMTEGRKFPFDLLQASANWVMPPFDETSEQYDGTVCLSKASFLDGFLLPRLAHINQESTWVVDEAWWKAIDGGFKNQYQVYGHLGLNYKDLQDPFFQDYQWKLTSQQNGVRTYEYHRTHKKDDNHGLWRVWQEGRTSNTLTIPEGLDSSSKCVMKLSGTTAIQTYLHLDGIGEIGKTTSLVTCTWEASLILDGVDQGELKITAETPKEPIIRTVED
ncbi:hypothetical protein FRC00_001940, partial [Tulasnella sp. 408]